MLLNRKKTGVTVIAPNSGPKLEPVHRPGLNCYHLSLCVVITKTYFYKPHDDHKGKIYKPYQI